MRRSRSPRSDSSAGRGCTSRPGRSGRSAAPPGRGWAAAPASPCRGGSHAGAGRLFSEPAGARWLSLRRPIAAVLAGLDLSPDALVIGPVRDPLLEVRWGLERRGIADLELLRERLILDLADLHRGVGRAVREQVRQVDRRV